MKKLQSIFDGCLTVLPSFLLYVLCFVLCASCTLQTKHRGYIFPNDLDVQVSKLRTVSDLEKNFGSPQARTIFGDNVLIYYGADENHRGPLPLTYDNKIVLLVWVDKDGKITQKKILRDDDLPNIWIDDDETQIPAAVELNAIEELINNIGRFTPAGLGQ